MNGQSLRFLQVGCFSHAMVLADLALVLRGAATPLGVPPTLANVMAVLAALFECVLVAGYLVKVTRFPDAVVAEFDNPWRVTLNSSAIEC